MEATVEFDDILALRKFVAPEIFFGAGAVHMAGRYAKNLGARKVLVVTDPGVMAAGWTKLATESLEAEGIDYVVFSQVTSNPRAEEVMAGEQVYQREGCSAIVAVGGGSPMDCAKAIGLVSANNVHVLTFEGVDEVPIPGPPMICIPTTAGTSADVSQFVMVTDLNRLLKVTIISKSVVPEVALIDPVTTTTMDAHLTACTGMDALSHAIEAYVSNAQSAITDLHALEAIRLITANLVTSIDRPNDIQIRGKMMLGSLHAGLAFSNASLGAAHAMAHSLGGFMDFAHGEANAFLLRNVIEFNFDTAPDRYLCIGKAMGLRDGEKSAILAEIARLQKAIGLDRRLGELGLRKSDIPGLARKSMHDPCMVTNPRKPTQQDIETIYEKAL
jgi:alcohol dehydrogenase class IV